MCLCVVEGKFSINPKRAARDQEVLAMPKAPLVASHGPRVLPCDTTPLHPWFIATRVLLTEAIVTGSI